MKKIMIGLLLILIVLLAYLGITEENYSSAYILGENDSKIGGVK